MPDLSAGVVSFQDGVCDEEVGDDPKAMQFAKMDVPEEYMATNDEELVLKMDQVRSRFDTTIRFYDSVSRFGVTIRHHGSISRFDVTRFQRVTSKK